MRQKTAFHISLTAGLAMVCICLTQAAWADFYGDASTKRYHTADSSCRKGIKARNLKKFLSEAEAGARGYYPCPSCVPPVGRPNEKAERRSLSQPVSRGAVYLGDVQRRVFHSAWCPRVKSLKPSDLRRFADVEKAEAAGYVRCKECNPPRRAARGAADLEEEDQ